jgi:hypothetical protein
MGDNLLRASLNAGDADAAAHARFDQAAARLRKQGGGVITIYYHPTEFVNLQFWDAVNFANGANPPREDWKRPPARTKEDSERCYRVMNALVTHIKKDSDVRFVTGPDLLTEPSQLDTSDTEIGFVFNKGTSKVSTTI